MGCIPEDDKYLEKDIKYWNFAKRPEGKYRMRIFGPMITGWEDWTVDGYKDDGKPKKVPIRTRANDKRPPINPKKPPQEFWALPVWVYNTKKVYLWILKQTSIMNALREFEADEDYGDINGYDIVVKRKKVGDKMTYRTNAMLPKSPIPDDIMEFYRAMPMRLEALYEGKDPFEDLDAPATEIVPPSTVCIENPDDEEEDDELVTLEMFASRLVKDGIDTAKLEEYLDKLAKEKQKTQAQIINFFWLEYAYPGFCQGYKSYIAA